MNRLSKFTSALCALSALTVALPAQAEQTKRFSISQRGDILVVGNTLGWDCGAGAPAPLLGTTPTGTNGCGVNAADSAPDVFWRADAPAGDQAQANNTVTADQARSTAFLDLPAGATVTNAYLYWAARRTGNSADTGAVFERPNVFTQAVTAVDSYTIPQGAGDVVYQSVADVTSLVLANGRGAYRVSGVDVQDFPAGNQDVLFAGWSLVVLYKLDSEPTRNLAVFDGLDGVQAGSPSSVSLSGFLVPTAGFDAKFGAIVYEGDQVFTGDSLFFGRAPFSQADRLSDPLNPADNFFNGTRSYLGAAVSKAGDLPRLTGQASTMAGMDLDVVDVTSRVKGGDTRVDLQATSTLDIYFLGGFVTSIATFIPDFTSSTKTVKDVNGGVLLAGDELEYSITVANTGDDASVNTVLTDALPAGVTLVPGSINVTTGANTGVKTEAAGDDQATYDSAARVLTVRLGTGATATAGGSVPSMSSSVVTFRVKVDATTRGIISNQGKIEGKGARGATFEPTVTDGNAGGPGSPTTDIPVAGCETNAQCGGATPICDTSKQPPVCVQCTEDKQCPGPGSTCDLKTNTCVCGGLPMSCMDTDMDGLSDPDETANGTDPSDADSDDDGVLDGAEKDPLKDTDGDGLINALDPDSDDDALFDGTEVGLGCSNPATDAKLGHCRADADPTTKTDPTDADSDDGGVRDGAEDVNFNGRKDGSEKDPTAGKGADDKSAVDTDGDGLSDSEEDTLHSDPKDTDSDDDGLLDGDERNPSDDTDGDGLVNVLDTDSDNDVLYDGTESGKGCGEPDTKPGHCIADGDAGKTTTSPVVPDTDRGGARDGSEDSNRDGVVNVGERDPTVGHGPDDTASPDKDGDGLSDPTEDGLGSDPNDADTDDDGVRDGDEANPGDDTDYDGKINVLDPDSDDDKLSDGTERGTACKDPATDQNKSLCRPDADEGKTTTSMVNPDTDFGGVPDGTEDTDDNGQIDPRERDPNNPADDGKVEVDAGVPDAGPPPVVDAGPIDAGYGNDYTVRGGGCACDVAATRSGVPAGTLWGAALVGLFWLRRRRRA